MVPDSDLLRHPLVGNSIFADRPNSIPADQLQGRDHITGGNNWEGRSKRKAVGYLKSSIRCIAINAFTNRTKAALTGNCYTGCVVDLLRDRLSKLPLGLSNHRHVAAQLALNWISSTRAAVLQSA